MFIYTNDWTIQQREVIPMEYLPLRTQSNRNAPLDVWGYAIKQPTCKCETRTISPLVCKSVQRLLLNVNWTHRDSVFSFLPNGFIVLLPKT